MYAAGLPWLSRRIEDLFQTGRSQLFGPETEPLSPQGTWDPLPGIERKPSPVLSDATSLALPITPASVARAGHDDRVQAARQYSSLRAGLTTLKRQGVARSFPLLLINPKAFVSFEWVCPYLQRGLQVRGSAKRDLQESLSQCIASSVPNTPA